MSTTASASTVISAQALPTPFVWKNGLILPESEAGVSPFDHGLLTGDGVFETLIIYRGEPFAFSRHYRRLVNSAERFGLDTPDKEYLLAATKELIDRCGVESARLRITLTSGRGALGSEKTVAAQTVLIAVSPLPGHGEFGHLVRVEWPRNEFGATVGVKTISYGENVIALAKAKENGGTEAIFGNTKGHLCEGTGSNVFFVRDGHLVTPPLTSGCLPGVTRALVIELAEKLGFACKQEDSMLADLHLSDEVFLTSTLREVQATKWIDGKEIPTGGPITNALRAAYQELIATETDA